MDRLTPSRRTAARRFPHARGDGPSASSAWIAPLRFSPRAWGWTGVAAAPATGSHVFPTRVGMDREMSREPLENSSFPHARGDGPDERVCEICAPRFSPRAWGWTVPSGNVTVVSAVFPTRVGMDRVVTRLWPITRCFPHARGDGPFIEKHGTIPEMFSPRAWGWTDPGATIVTSGIVFPTRVGMDRCMGQEMIERRGFPHARGDGPTPLPRIGDSPTFSPRAWGWTAGAGSRGGLAHVFPTRVGMDRAST